MTVICLLCSDKRLKLPLQMESNGWIIVGNWVILCSSQWYPNKLSGLIHIWRFKPLMKSLSESAFPTPPRTCRSNTSRVATAKTPRTAGMQIETKEELRQKELNQRVVYHKQQTEAVHSFWTVWNSWWSLKRWIWDSPNRRFFNLLVVPGTMNLGLTESQVFQTGSVEEVIKLNVALKWNTHRRWVQMTQLCNFGEEKIITKNANRNPSCAQNPCRWCRHAGRVFYSVSTIQSSPDLPGKMQLWRTRPGYHPHIYCPPWLNLL